MATGLLERQTLSSNSWAKRLTYLDIHDLLCRDWLGALEWNDAEHFVIHPRIRLPWMHLEVGPDFSVPFPQDSPRQRDSLQPPITPGKPCQSESFVLDPSPPRNDYSISYHLVFWGNKNQYSNTSCWYWNSGTHVNFPAWVFTTWLS